MSTHTAAMAQPHAAGIGTRSLGAASWAAGGAAGRLVLQVVTQIILARLLGPEQFGIFVIGATVISFSAFFSDIGLAYGLIQKQQVGEHDIRFVFTWQVVLGLITAAAVYGAAGLIAGFFGDPRARPVIEALSVVCLINSLTAPSLNLLKREIDFRTLQVAQLIGYAGGYVLVGLPLAWAGFEVWALVAAWLVQAAVTGVLMYRAVRHPLLPLPWYVDARQQSAYGVTVFFTNLVNWCTQQIDRVVVGQALGSRDIGLYATSHNLLYTPAATLAGVVQPVFFSAAARLEHDRERILTGYRTILAAFAMGILPLFVGTAVVAPTFVLALYGQDWAEAGGLVRPLALAMPWMFLFTVTTPLLWTAGKAGLEFRMQGPFAVLTLIACVAAARQSVEAVAWVVAALALVRSLVVLWLAVKVTGLQPRAIGASTRSGLELTAWVCGILLALESFLPPLAAQARLGLELVAGLTAVAVFLSLRRASLPPELAAVLDRGRAALPVRLRRCWPAAGTSRGQA